MMVKGLAAQEWQRSTILVGGSVYCAYLNNEGHKCPVGFILPPEALITPLNVSVSNLSVDSQLDRLCLGELSDREYFFLVEAQTAHDGIGMGEPTDVKENFRKLAEVFNIDPLPEELSDNENA